MDIKLSSADRYRIKRKVESEIARADREIRRRSQGRDETQVMRLAERLFASIGLELPKRDLSGYASAVVADAPFRFDIRF